MENKNSKINIQIPEEISGLFKRHYDQVFLNDSIPKTEVILVCMYMIETKNKESSVDYSLCKEYFSALGYEPDSFRKAVYDAKQSAYIQGDDKKLSFKLKGLKKIEQITGQIGKTPVFIIKAGENFTAIKRFEEFLLKYMSGDKILLCDSHISDATLFPFTIVKDKVRTLQVLTANIHNSLKFKKYVNIMQKEFGIKIEVKENKKIHDRFIIFENSCWIIGTSIKDLGNKDSFIQEITGIMHSVNDLFNLRWHEAT